MGDGGEMHRTGCMLITVHSMRTKTAESQDLQKVMTAVNKMDDKTNKCHGKQDGTKTKLNTPS